MLRKFAWRPRRHKGGIKCVRIDMSNAYSSRVGAVLPKAQVVYDRFHVIRAMTEKTDHVRRREMARLDDRAKRAVKGHRFVFMRNAENLDSYGRRILERMRESNMRLSDAHALKDSLRRICRFSESCYDAKMEFPERCSSTRASAIPETIQMVKTVERHLSGILGYWDFDHASSGSAEGFNTKMRLLVKQSYGIRDFKYLRLKICDLPSRRIKTHI